MGMVAGRRYDAVLFDLLTALLDSWSLWNRVAGSVEAGRRWRAEYLQLTYGCGAYRAYGELVAQAAAGVGLPEALAADLERDWGTLELWPGALGTLRELGRSHRLGVVTNCSERLGRMAAERLGVTFEGVVTAERAGYYKPHPAPYRLALEELGLPADRVLFVAGSGYDLFGTAGVGLDTFWHNRLGLSAPAGAPAPLAASAELADVLGLVSRR
jgi:2-haloalkanoic acid dehalogenase type II